MNGVFFALVAIAVALAGGRELAGQAGLMDRLGAAIGRGAESAVQLGLSLAGTMAVFLGLMRVAEKGGLTVMVARLLRRPMARLFPEVPPDHPAMGAMILNLSANLLGLGNAATPFGIRAMQELDRLAPRRGVASDAMILFLALNTASLTVLPTKVMALRAASGSADPAAVIPTTLFATLVATLVGVIACKLWPRRPLPPAARDAPELAPRLDGTEPAAPVPAPAPLWATALAGMAVLAVVPLGLLWGRQAGPWILPGLMVGMLGFGVARRVRVYEAFVEGAHEGLLVAWRVLPYVVAILVAIGMFRASGAMELLVAPLGRLTAPLGLPAEAITMAALRTLSGSGAYGLLAEILKTPGTGPDTPVGLLVSTIYGSTETTFYVLAVYFGAVGVRRIRHALVIGLLADFAALVAAVVICR